jgi:hypothetical protein
MQLHDGEYARLARMDRELIAALDKAFRDENENDLKLKMLQEELLLSMARLERHERETG